MGLTTALYTGLSGINVNQQRIETIGHNIANVNTTSFKSSRTLFQSQFSRTLSLGSGPSATSGGTNPMQFGLGAVIGSTDKDFAPGSVETTGVSSDLAIEGNGFFVLRTADGKQVYTRDGAFTLDAGNRLVTADGAAVMGFGVDGTFSVIPGVLEQLQIPLGTLSLATPTSIVSLDGDLSADGTPATEGTVHVSQDLVDAGGAAVTAGTALTDVRPAAAAGTPLFAVGDRITVSRLTKGDREVPAQDFIVGTTGNTLGDFANWLEGVLGIQRASGVPGNPGIVVENGTLVVRGNAGLQNALEIDTTDISSNNANTALPFQFTQTADANGSGSYTAFTVYDSLGSPLTVNVTFTLDATPDTGPVWRFYAESADNVDGARPLGTGTVAFDTEGNFVSASGNQFTINRSGTGATTPLTFTLDLAGIHGLSTQTSNVILAEQDGVPPGTLANYSVGKDGIVTGIFSNGMTRTLGQIAVAVFANPQGLLSEPDNTYVVGPNAGTPAIMAPGQFGAGRILAGALELSNVDLSREFIGLIMSSTGFQASSRIISVTSDLLDQLMLIAR
ncbi:MAG: flagellar hook-basal body complex protein [Planctomycetes bacterium]|nr:flagellar hook-basal body complex protein [Planctomycetota bacterium]